MPYIDPQKQKAYAREHYRRNAEIYKQRARAHTQAQRVLLRDEVIRAKDRPCADCGQKFPTICMDFDHGGNPKDNDVSTMVNRGVSLQRLRAEISKCEVVCSNCHRLRSVPRLSETATTQAS